MHCKSGMSVAHELSGLSSTRVVRFLASVRRRIDEPDDMATGPQDAEVLRCVEPMDGAFGSGSERGGDDAQLAPAEMEQHGQFGSFTSPPVARRGTRRSPAAWLPVLPCQPKTDPSSSAAENSQRATMLTPQGLDAQHGGGPFPIDESRRTPTLLTLGCAPHRQGRRVVS